MKIIILAGGSGTRLWPLSRKNFPKQFLKIYNEKSLFRETIDRYLKRFSPEDLLILSNRCYKFYIHEELGDLSDFKLLLEPASRNTAPSIALAVKYLLDLEIPSKEVLFISPADHVIRPEEEFLDQLLASQNLAQKGYIVTFGIKPTRPETGYGYIKLGERLGEAYLVEKFTEKPDLETAKSYLASKKYLWNSGMFAFTLETIREEYQRLCPEIAQIFEKSWDEALEEFSYLPNISIDYAIMERSDKLVVKPLDLYWNDIGSWDSVAEVFAQGKGLEKEVVFKGKVETLDSKRCFIWGDKREIIGIGIEDLIVVDTSDALLIAKKGKTQEVKKVVDILKAQKSSVVEDHLTVYKPWGNYKVLEIGPRYKIKKLIIKPGARLSLQMHYHRSEHWIVVKGTAKVKIGEKDMFVHENESVFIPTTTLHRLENPGKKPLEIIEVQTGEYLEEDDIVRFEDDWGREKSD